LQKRLERFMAQIHFELIIKAHELAALMQQKTLEPSHPKRLVIFDLSHDLSDPQWGLLQYQDCHIPGAFYADLSNHLSAHGDEPCVNAGRHPLPSREHFAQWLSLFGIGPSTQVVVYDRNNMNFCARLWWMLKWCGHAHVAVLDGSFKAWTTCEFQTESGHLESDKTDFHPFELQAPLLDWVSTQSVLEHLGPEQTLIDARSPQRFRGELEPLDPQAGHIPGALNRPFALNLDENGFFKPAELLKQEFLTLLAGKDPASVIHHCGSGVSAVPNIIAFSMAGLGQSKLYAGSFSEWSRTPGLPVVQGA
jgi:thiosulfate/3-mercaptopyruvate sulfurtransferase